MEQLVFLWKWSATGKKRKPKAATRQYQQRKGPASFVVKTLFVLKIVTMAHFLCWFLLQCNKIPEERRYALPLKSIYMRQIDHMVGLYWMMQHACQQQHQHAADLLLGGQARRGLACRTENRSRSGPSPLKETKKAKPGPVTCLQASWKASRKEKKMQNRELGLLSELLVCVCVSARVCACARPWVRFHLSCESWHWLCEKCHFVICKRLDPLWWSVQDY